MQKVYFRLSWKNYNKDNQDLSIITISFRIIFISKKKSVSFFKYFFFISHILVFINKRVVRLIIAKYYLAIIIIVVVYFLTVLKVHVQRVCENCARGLLKPFCIYSQPVSLVLTRDDNFTTMVLSPYTLPRPSCVHYNAHGRRLMPFYLNSYIICIINNIFVSN